MNKILSWQVPASNKELKQFLGLSSYYSYDRKFVCRFSNIFHPLHTAIQVQDTEFKWLEEANSAFNKLKELLTTALVLGYQIWRESLCWRLTLAAMGCVVSVTSLLQLSPVIQTTAHTERAMGSCAYSQTFSPLLPWKEIQEQK